MQSAFGVDHGEVSKAFNPVAGVRAANAARGLKTSSQAKAATGRTNALTRGDRIRTGAKKAGAATKRGAQAFVNTPVSINDVVGGSGRAIGGSFKALGEAASKNPGATGVAAVGGAGVGGLAISRRSANKREKKIRAEYEKK